MAAETGGKSQIPLLGVLALKNNLITKDDLQTALSKIAGAEDKDSALKEYFLSKALVSDINIKRLIQAAKAFSLRQKEFKFGAIAVQKGFINKSILKLVLEEQQADIKAKQKVRLIGDMLVEAGMITYKQRDYILKLQKRVRDESAKPVKGKSKNKDGKGDPDTEKPKEKEAGLLEPEIIAGGIKLQISSDYMGAFLSKTDYFDSNVTVKEVKEALFEKGVVLGVVTDEMIQGFISSSGFKTKAFRVAKGVAPIDGKDAQIEFFFNIDYLKAGGMTKDGSIDFKDRGEVPMVEEGTVLAEKIPAVESRNGHNIYGDEIPTTPGNDLPFKFGKGAKLSEDGYKVIAAIRGFPKYALSGHIFVHDIYITDGDVDYETGHVQYDGNVEIKGRIKSGFKVKGNDVRAVEIDGGEIDAEGDVTILGGINEGKIRARGNVYAKFILNSKVICMGDVVVQKEIVDSKIENSGTCVAENGKVISSKVTSKMGIKAKNIGTEMAVPCTIKVGHDVFTEKELEKNKEKLDKIKAQIAQLHEKMEGLNQENNTLQKQITELAHIQDRSQLEEKELSDKLGEIESIGEDPSQVEELRGRIKQLQEKVKEAEENLDLCFDKTEELEEKIDQEKELIASYEQKLADCQQERDNLIKWSKENPGRAQVEVAGSIMPETLIRGQHSELRIADVTSRVKVTEVLCRSEGGQSLNIYEMQIGNL